MVTAVARLELSLAGCRSLKDKRQILRSAIERTRNRFQVAIAEVEDQDLWQRAVVGIAAVSGSGRHAAEVVEAAIRYIESAHPECDIVAHDIELFTS